MLFKVAAIACSMLAVARFAVAQNHTLVGVVVARGSGERLAYSIVGLPSLSRERFSNDSGVFAFGELPSSGGLPIRVRRLGYAPLDTFITVGTGQPDTLRIELHRVAVELRGVTVSAFPPCRNPGVPKGGGDSALTVIFNQIRMNAEQYRFLAEQYPFTYTVEIIRSSRLKSDGQTRIDSHRWGQIDAKPAWKYKPGRVVSRRAVSYFFHIPTLVDLADKTFLENHCFHYGGTKQIGDTTLFRVHLVASEKIRDPDVDGTIFIDPTTFQVRRTELRLSRISRELKYLTDFEVTTEFREIMPSVPVIFTVESIEHIDPATKIAFDMAWETQKLAGYEFHKRKPGDDLRKP